MYKVTGQFPWSSLKETDRGMSAELNVGIGAIKNSAHEIENNDFHHFEVILLLRPNKAF